GVDAESIAYAAESLRLLRAEIMRRTERLKGLDRAVCPDKRVTREIGAKRSLKLWPLACIIDEAQNLFADPDHGKAAGLDAEFIIKIGPAFGVFLVIATQRPDKASLPTGVSGNVSTRFCLKVTGQVENDMILGTSAYKNGLRSTTSGRGSTLASATWWAPGPPRRSFGPSTSTWLTLSGWPPGRGRCARPPARSLATRPRTLARARATCLPTSCRCSAATPGSSGATSLRGWRPGSRPVGKASPLMRSRPSAALPASPQSTSAAAVGRARAAAGRQSRPRQAPGEPPQKGRRRPIR
ncbi:MAG TPA: hypothetical protein VGF32_15990, partial [Streptosporangiaceae bacterium]